MKKTPIILLALAAIVLAALPYIFGVMTEREVRARLAEASSKGQLIFEITNYERGYLSSKADVLVRLDFLGEVANQDPEDLKLTRLLVQGTINHGPLTFLAGQFEGESAPFLALGSMDAALFFEEEPFFYQMFFGEAALLTARISIGFTGNLNLAIKGQQLAYKAPDGSLEIDWKGFLAKMIYRSGQLTGTVDGPGLFAKTPLGSFDLLGYRSSFDLSKHPTGYYLGRQSMTMEGVKVAVAEQNLFTGGKLSLEYDSATEGPLMSFNSSLDFGKFEVGHRSFGPMQLKTLGRSIDLSGLKMLEDAYREALQGSAATEKGAEAQRPDAPMESGGKPSEALFQAKLGESTIAAINKIIAGGPLIEVPLFLLDTPEGNIRGNVKMTINKDARINPEAPEASASLLLMDFKLTVPKSLAVEFTKLSKVQDLARSGASRVLSDEEITAKALALAQKDLEDKIQRGYYLPMGNDLTLEGDLKNGVLTINGKRIPL